jgi:hypothetical protein
MTEVMRPSVTNNGGNVQESGREAFHIHRPFPGIGSCEARCRSSQYSNALWHRA